MTTENTHRAKKTRKSHLRKQHFKADKRTDLILLGIILLVAAVLRLWRFPELPFMHDELSALYRTKFDSFGEMVRGGIYPDSHPAGVQVFLYYLVMLVGMSEFWVKLPFALMGIASVYLTYLIGRLWYSRKTGLMAAAVFAASQFTVFYSQLARPYAVGLFFVLLFAVFWTKMVFGQKKPSVWLCVGFAITAALTALAHNFSTATAGLIFLTGLFFLPKERRIHYWMSGVGAVVVYSPNLPVFYHQLFEYGSIGGWLATPKSTFLVDFVQYTMNFSSLFMFTAGVVIVLPLIYGHWQKGRNQMRIVSVVWFLIVFGVAYAYSLLREPILQYSTLIFVYPFLLVTLFSLYKNRSIDTKVTVIVVMALLFVGVESLMVDRKHYQLMYEQGFDGIAKSIKEDKDTLGDVHSVTWSDNPFMSEFYQKPNGIDKSFILGRYNNMADMSNAICGDTSQFLCFGWTDYADPRYDVMAVAAYPYKIAEKTWFSSHYMSLSRDPYDDAEEVFHKLNTAPYHIEGEWTQSYIIKGDTLDANTDLFGVAADLVFADTARGYHIVLEVKDATSDSLLYWSGSAASDTVRCGGRNIISSAFRFREIGVKPQEVVIRTYIWNTGHNSADVSKIGYYSSVYDNRIAALISSLH